MPKSCSNACSLPLPGDGGEGKSWAELPGATARAWPSEQMIRLLCRTIPAERRSELTIMDVGCGNGRNACALAAMGFGRVLANDPVASLVAEAKEKGEGIGGGVEGVEAALPTLPYADGCADVAVCWGVLYVLPNREAVVSALGEVRRVLRPGGYLLSDWRTDGDSLRRYAEASLDEVTVVLGDEAPLDLGGMRYSFWSEEGVCEVHEAAGFGVVDMQREEIEEVATGARHSWWQLCAQRHEI